MKKFALVGLLALSLFCGTVTLVGCGSPDSGSGSSTGGSGLSVGQKLYRPDGSLFGTITALEDAHQFENGAVEPGALVDYGPPMGAAWLPQRSAATMAR
jgi:hypothetical protein